MPYQQTDWKDHVVEKPNTYTETVNDDGTITHTEAPGEIIQQGTPMSATNFNNAEAGIGAASMMADALFIQLLAKLGHSDNTIDEVAESKLDKDGKAVDSEKADRLGTARTIAISGGATGTATSFDGSADISIPVTELSASALTGSVAIANGGTGATDAQTARTNLEVPSTTDLTAAIIYADAKAVVEQTIARDHEERLITIEAQLNALGGTA